MRRILSANYIVKPFNQEVIYGHLNLLALFQINNTLSPMGYPRSAVSEKIVSFFFEKQFLVTLHRTFLSYLVHIDPTLFMSNNETNVIPFSL